MSIKNKNKTLKLTIKNKTLKLVYLFKAWLNEKLSPELLEHKTSIVECIIEQINNMESNIQNAKKGDFRVALHKLELDRIKYILFSYLRVRIRKVDKIKIKI